MLGKKTSKKKRPSWYGVPSAPTMTALKRSILDSYTLTNIVSVGATAEEYKVTVHSQKTAIDLRKDVGSIADKEKQRIK